MEECSYHASCWSLWRKWHGRSSLQSVRTTRNPNNPPCIRRNEGNQKGRLTFFPSLMAQAYSKMTMPGFIRLKLLRAVQEAWDYFHTWIGNQRDQTFTPPRILRMRRGRRFTSVVHSRRQFKIKLKRPQMETNTVIGAEIKLPGIVCWNKIYLFFFFKLGRKLKKYLRIPMYSHIFCMNCQIQTFFCFWTLLMFSFIQAKKATF